jgi:hypothetical protein
VDAYEALIRRLADPPNGEATIYVLSDLCMQLMSREPSCHGHLSRTDQQELALRLRDVGDLRFRGEDDAPDPGHLHFTEILLGPILANPDGLRVEGGLVCGSLCGTGAVYILEPTGDGYEVTGTDDSYGTWVA